MNDSVTTLDTAPVFHADARRASLVPLIFVRHGETDWNREFRFQGQRDIALNGVGRLQAARNGRALAGILASDDWHLVASPLSRAVETMRIMLNAAGAGGRGFTTDPMLVEVNYGDWEGLTLPEIGESFPAQRAARDRDKWNYAPPNGESYAILSQRVGKWLASVSVPTIVVAHGGILRALLHILARLPSHDAPHLEVPQDRVIMFSRRDVLTI